MVMVAKYESYDKSGIMAFGTYTMIIENLGCWNFRSGSGVKRLKAIIQIAIEIVVCCTSFRVLLELMLSLV